MIMLLRNSYFCVLFMVIYFVVPHDAARILCVFLVPSISHQVVFRPLTQELARRGHEVIVLTPDPAFPKGKPPTNLTEIDVHDKSYEIWIERFVKKVDGDSSSSFDIVKGGLIAMRDIFEYQMNTPEMQAILKGDQHFDLIFTEAMVRPALVLSHLIKAPLIQISSFGAIPPLFEIYGIPVHPILYPSLMRKKMYDLTLWEKIYGTYEDTYLSLLQRKFEEPENTMLKRIFGPNTPPVSELSYNADMLFLNINPIFNGNQPVPPNVIFMGGLHQKPIKELPGDLKTFLDRSKHGVIYMSFGTNVSPSQLPSERIQIFNKVFSKLPYDVLWKWDKDVMPGKAENVRISKWLPQIDLLRHPKIKLFITQGGLQSTDESITAGVPLIAFPMLGDQWYNAEKYVHHKIGLHLDIKTITEQTLEDSIKTVISDESYRRNVVKLGKIFNDQPQTPLERAVWWTEYVIRHGGAKHLRSPAANISWTEYLMLDVVLAIIATVVIGISLLSLVLCASVKNILNRNSKIKQN